MSSGWDVVVLGGGIIGSASALALARRGARVLVVDKGTPGAEASSAAAGILGAQVEAHEDGELARLLVKSRAMYAAWARGLEEASGVDVGYRACGALRLFATEDERVAGVAASSWQRAAGLALEALSETQLAALEPAIAPTFVAAERYPDDAQVEPRALVRALLVTGERAGVVFRGDTAVRAIARKGDRALGVELEDGARIEADHVVLAAGSWSSLVEGTPLGATEVVPMRGQLVELTLDAPILDHAIFGPGAYLVPRNDGRVVVGSTMELVGHRRAVTAKGARDLLSAAIAIAPALADATLTATWSGFRPFARGGAPLVGPSSLRGLVLATGHHRNGVLLAPLTGELVADAIASVSR